MSRSLFLSLDGIDGCGKTTQCRGLVEWLVGQGRSAILCIDPGGTTLGIQLRQILLHGRGDLALPAEALLFLASRAQLVQEIIRPALGQGKVVISDRFTLANVVYQGYAGGLDVASLWQVGRLATGGLEPDRTFLLDLPVEQAKSRRGSPSDRLESRPPEYHERVRAGFLTEAANHSNQITVVDASADAETVQTNLRRLIAPLL